MSPQSPEWVGQARTNAQALEREIDKLSSDHWDWFERDYKKFWAHARSISQMFKDLKPLLKEDRERLWAHFNSTCADAKHKQQAAYDKRDFRSRQLANNVLDEVRAARVAGVPGVWTSYPDIDMMKQLGQRLNKASAMLSEHKKEMIGEHKQECFQEIQEVRDQHDSWWRHLNSERARRRDERESRMRANLEKNRDRHRKASEALHHYRSKADDLRDKIASAWNDNWRSDAYGWLSDLEDKIRDIERSLEQIENWMAEDEAKLR